MATVLNKRGTRANLDALASSNGLNAGEIYLITDESKIAVGLSTSDYQVYQKEFSGTRVSGVYYAGNTSAVTQISSAALTAQGTGASRAINSTGNKLQASKRYGYVSPTAVGNFCGGYGSSDGVIGNSYPASNGFGKFEITFRFGCSDAATVAGARGFIGIADSTGIINVEPSTILKCIGIAQLSTDATQYYLVYGGSSAQTPIALGTALGAPNDNTALIDFKITAMNDTSFRYRVKNLSNGVIVSGTVTGTASTQIPAAGTGMRPKLWRCNNATALAVALDICFIHSESEL